MPDAFFTPTADPDVFLATRHTVGPWSPQLQHGGPPAALLTREMERVPASTAPPGGFARLTFEILGPVPVGEVRVRARLARPGRSVEMVEGELVAAGRTVVQARAWRIRAAALDLPGHAPRWPAPPRPAVAADPALWQGYLAAMEWRFVSGAFERAGPAQVWARQRVPLVADEPPTPVQRLVTVADSGNGLSGQYDFNHWWYINTELTIHLHAVPAGEWIAVHALSTLDASGLGLAETELYDESGRIGRGAQALMVGAR